MAIGYRVDALATLPEGLLRIVSAVVPMMPACRAIRNTSPLLELILPRLITLVFLRTFVPVCRVVAAINKSAGSTQYAFATDGIREGFFVAYRADL